ncbi:type II toxin-antitoxin system VapC family toxin [Ekhidna sp.]|uniref:type II toxin-antitoxin system VapC family toxin n=1 Tax=Ekhidna sp. TaxID=2608089 RepID=UPI003C7D904E
MSYLLDTCVVSDFVKGDNATLEKLRSVSPIQVKISSVTAYELFYGLSKNATLKKGIKEAVLGFINDVEILPFRIEESQIAAKIRANLEREGNPIGPYDVLIASTALENKLTLVTSNVSEFQRIPLLKMENWRES